MADITLTRIAETDKSDPLSGEWITAARIIDGPNEYRLRVVTIESIQERVSAKFQSSLADLLCKVIDEAFRLGKEART